MTDLLPPHPRRRASDHRHPLRTWAGENKVIVGYIVAALVFAIPTAIAAKNYDTTNGLVHRVAHNANDLKRVVQDNRRALVKIDQVQKTSTRQFCRLQLSRVHDLERQVRQTEKFLAGPLAEDNSGITTAVRVALPRTIRAAERERANTPPICLPPPPFHGP